MSESITTAMVINKKTWRFACAILTLVVWLYDRLKKK